MFNFTLWIGIYIFKFYLLDLWLNWSFFPLFRTKNSAHLLHFKAHYLSDIRTFLFYLIFHSPHLKSSFYFCFFTSLIFSFGEQKNLRSFLLHWFCVGKKATKFSFLLSLFGEGNLRKWQNLLPSKKEGTKGLASSFPLKKSSP